VESSDNTIEKNIASKNQVGILVLEHCDNNKFAFNKISNNGLGIITFESNNNKFLQNRITHSSDQGIHLVLSNNSIIAGNYVSNNNYGILLSMTKNNTIYHNDFIDNTNQVYLYQAIDTKWDDDYPSGGNYWSDYTYEDLYSGPAQGTPGSDGIWDLPYFIDADNQDRYPLVEPWTLSPTERIQQLIETIETWTLPTGTETCLTSKLDDAIHLLSIGNENGAIRNLTEFIHQVETLRNKKLEDDEADYLIAEAQRIIDLIEEQNP